MGSGVSGIVGRASELERLDAELESLAAGRATCLAMEGEPGMGKTALLAELQRRAEERGHTTLTGSAAEFERDLPFGAWADALDAYVASQEPGPRDGFNQELIGDLAGVLPSLGRPRGDGDPAQADARFRSHRAMRKLLELLAERKPLVLVLDDLHWADSASVELIGSLLRRGPDAPVLLAIAFRAGAEPSELRSALADPSVARVALAPLSEQECSQLVGDTLDSERVAAIFDESGGNPFYTWQLARAAELPAPHPSGRGTAGNGGVPGAVSAALMARAPEALAGFSGAAEQRIHRRRPVRAGAGLRDRRARARRRHRGTGRAARRFADPIPRRFAFRHPLVRRAVYESTKGGWQLGAHARAATALARRGASRHRASPSRGAVGRPGRRRRDRAADRRGPRQRLPVPGGRRPLVRGRASAAAGNRHRHPNADTGGPRRRAQGHGEARRLPGRPDRGARDRPPEDAALRLRLTTSCALAESFLGLHEEARDDLPPRSRPSRTRTHGTPR